eukprot:snap_masked-scaffold350_size199587-processed-gene-0.14 protein:Tk01167 transcript:snap_masked-scaffold350_size199587-processed-gene-0.14-mRNA-1 annotation:"hypothetical protein DAPPUDRAFT_119745"
MTKVKKYFDQRSRDLPELQIGTAIKIQDPQTKVWDRNGIITDVRKGSLKIRNSGMPPKVNKICQ